MIVHVAKDRDALGAKSAEVVATEMRRVLQEKGRVAMVVATGASQFEFLEHLTADASLDWTKVVAFHLDEYVGLPVTHPASFRKYLRERFLAKLPRPIGAFHEVNGENDPAAECARLNALIGQYDIDICCLGIGENSHIAFNDPPADFVTEDAFIVVDLNETCRQQQVNEGWFATTGDVPRQAISMSVKQIMRCAMLVNSVPGERKAQAVKWTLDEPVSPDYPATIMRDHARCYLNVDAESYRFVAH
ncbi:MAG: glucosamine-6-phosphate deaminase [Kiritimatiellaeota bacterium]|nr:glucosamine-6-phosphate deaminase [Kiritimatiellota bacterium]